MQNSPIVEELLMALSRFLSWENKLFRARTLDTPFDKHCCSVNGKKIDGSFCDSDAHENDNLYEVRSGEVDEWDHDHRAREWRAASCLSLHLCWSEFTNWSVLWVGSSAMHACYQESENAQPQVKPDRSPLPLTLSISRKHLSMSPLHILPRFASGSSPVSNVGILKRATLLR